MPLRLMPLRTSRLLDLAAPVLCTQQLQKLLLLIVMMVGLAVCCQFRLRLPLHAQWPATTVITKTKE
jgi:hypothetical protein